MHWGFLGWPTVWVQIDKPLFLSPLSLQQIKGGSGLGGVVVVVVVVVVVRGGSIPLQE